MCRQSRLERLQFRNPRLEIRHLPTEHVAYVAALFQPAAGLVVHERANLLKRQAERPGLLDEIEPVEGTDRVHAEATARSMGSWQQPQPLVVPQRVGRDATASQTWLQYASWSTLQSQREPSP